MDFCVPLQETKKRMTYRIKALSAFLFLISFSVSADTPVMGWSSWNAFRVNISDTLIMRQADLLDSLGLADAGYRQVNIDDGFFGYRDGNGRMECNPYRFPGGMKRVADHIHSLGLKAGIYSDGGRNTCGSIWDKDSAGIGSGFYGHELQDAVRYFGDWDFDFIKIDYCGGQEQKLKEEETYRRIADAIRRVKPNAAVNICRWAFPGTWAADVASSWRISGDINDTWESIKYIMGKALPLSGYARDGHYNDLDMLAIGFTGNSGIGGKGLTPTEEEAHFGLWCIMSSPLLIGCDLSIIPATSLALLKNRELIAVNQDPLHLQARIEKTFTDGALMAAKDLKERYGKHRAFVLYNPGDSAVEIDLTPETIGFEETVGLCDLTHGRTLGRFNNIFSFTLLPHSATVYSAEGLKRTEPETYEAEWAFCKAFNDIGTSPVSYLTSDTLSCGYATAGLGGSPDNYIDWTDVYSRRGGQYEATLILAGDNSGTLPELEVNGHIHKSTGRDGNAVSYRIKLNKGLNRVRAIAVDGKFGVDALKVTRI